MASIRKRRSADGKISFHVQVRVQGNPPQTKTFGSKTLARQWAAHVETELRAGRYLPSIEGQRHTVREMLEAYRVKILVPTNPKRLRDQGQQLDWWIGKLGDYSLANVTPALIGKCRDELLAGETKRKAKRTNATVLRYLAVLSHAFNIAVREWQWLEDSPMRKVSKPRAERGRVRFLSDDERLRLLAACQASLNAYLYIVVIIALSTGMRSGEIMKLRWRDILIEGKTGGSRALLDETKNGERRAVPLAGHALAVIQQLAAKAGERAPRKRLDPDALLFPSAAKSKQPISLRKTWETALRKANIDNFRFHDLRHTAASYLAMNGASGNEIAEVLGHKDLQMVKRYTHLSQSHVQGVVERMNAKMFGVAPAGKEKSDAKAT